VPTFNNGIVTVVSRSPLRAALGAGLGKADAEPIFSVVTVPSELNPVPVITTSSSTAAEDGVMVMLGFGVENSVVLPVICPTVADII
jgi:hypothetical protein